jgi:hypothetical protein
MGKQALVMNKAMRPASRTGNHQEYSHSTAFQNYVPEWLLDRISVSRHKDKFVLMGWLLIVLVGIESRTTMDMDTTMKGFPLFEEKLKSSLAENCAISLDDS